MQTVRCAVETDIGLGDTLVQPCVQSTVIGALVNETAFVKGGEKIGTDVGHGAGFGIG